MSDDEEMTDVSQTITQSGSSYTFTSFSLSYKESQPDPWGRITIYEVQRKRLGSHPIKYEKIEKRVLGKKVVLLKIQFETVSISPSQSLKPYTIFCA